MSQSSNLAKVSSQRMRKFRRVGSSLSKLRPASKFKFKKLIRQRLHTRQMSLSQGGRVTIEAVRDPGELTMFKPSASRREVQGNLACNVNDWSAEIITRESVLYNPNFTLLYPGAVFDYESIANGEYKSLPFARKPLTVTIDGVNFSKPAVRVANPSESTVRQAIADIKGSQRFPPGTNTESIATRVTSEEDLFIQTGGYGYFFGAGGSHRFNFADKRKSYKYFLEVTQVYYTLSVDDTVHEPSDFFVTKTEQPNNAKAISESQLDPNWVYVESVTYGRMLQIMFESEKSFESVNLNIEGHVNFLVTGGGADLTTNEKILLDKSTMHVGAIGGRGDLAGTVVNSTAADLRSNINKFFAGTNDERPIAYSLRTLDGAAVGTRMITQFTSRECAPVADFYKVTWKNVRCQVSDDQNSHTDAEETKLMVRVRAFNGSGDEILDVAKLNADLMEIDKVRKKTGTKLVPLPWTFRKGNEKHPVTLQMGEIRDMSQHSIKFAITPGDKNAKIGIRADVLEFDGLDSDDDFTDENKTFSISEIGSGKKVELICTEGDSRIHFNFIIEPVFEE